MSRSLLTAIRWTFPNRASELPLPSRPNLKPQLLLLAQSQTLPPQQSN